MGLLSRAARRALRSGEMFGQPAGDRLARAEALGFDTSRRLYHGTRSANVTAFDDARLGTNSRAVDTKAHYFTDDPLVANVYTERLDISRPDVREVRAWAASEAPELLPKIEAWASGRLKGKALWALEDELIDAYARGQAPNVIPVYVRGTDDFLEHDFGGQMKEGFGRLLEKARAEGKRGAVFRNVYDLGNNPDGSRRVSNVYAIFDPSDVRSIFAQFDPSRRHESDLLAGLAVGAPTGLLALAAQGRGRATS